MTPYETAVASLEALLPEVLRPAERRAVLGALARRVNVVPFA